MMGEPRFCCLGAQYDSPFFFKSPGSGRKPVSPILYDTRITIITKQQKRVLSFEFFLGGWVMEIVSFFCMLLYDTHKKSNIYLRPKNVI